MSTVVEVRLVPALVPAPRRELPPVGTAPAPTHPTGRGPGGPGPGGPGPTGPDLSGPGSTGPDPTAPGPTGPDPTGQDRADPSGTVVGPVAPALPVRPGPARPPTGSEGPRDRPVRSRSAGAAALAACLPEPERLGAAMLATYRHGLPGAADAAADDGRGVGRTDRREPAPPRGLVTGAVNPLDPRQTCCMVALAAVEVLTGTRPIAQLARWVTPGVYDALARRAALTAPRTRVLDPAAAQRDLRDADPAAWARRPSVRRVRACPVDEHTLEASVVVAHADRVRAVALRLTREAGRWRASALVVG